MLRWPEEEAIRRALAAERRPRLLVVGAGAEPPQVLDELEDWLRDPPDPADLLTRLASLSQRSEQRRARPHLDADGLLWSGSRWVVVPDGQLGVVDLLLTSANELVRTEAVSRTYVRHGGSGHRASVRTMLNRLQGRFADVGLVLHFVRGKGVLLEVPGTDRDKPG